MPHSRPCAPPCGLTLNLVFTILSATLAWATLAAILGRGRRQAFWAGFAVFAWPYLLKQACSQFDVAPADLRLAAGGGLSPLVSTLRRALSVLPRRTGRPETFNRRLEPELCRAFELTANFLYDLDRHYFIAIGHAAAGLIVGMSGGFIALRIYLSERRHAVYRDRNRGATTKVESLTASRWVT